MALNARQRALYTHTVNIYRKKRITNNDFGYKLTYTAVKCYMFTTFNVDKALGVIGKIKQSNVFTDNDLHCDATTDIRAHDLVKVTMQGAVLNTWYEVAGEPDIHFAAGARATNYAHVYLVPCDPPVITT